VGHETAPSPDKSQLTARAECLLLLDSDKEPSNSSVIRSGRAKYSASPWSIDTNFARFIYRQTEMSGSDGASKLGCCSCIVCQAYSGSPTRQRARGCSCGVGVFVGDWFGPLPTVFACACQASVIRPTRSSGLQTAPESRPYSRTSNGCLPARSMRPQRFGHRLLGVHLTAQRGTRSGRHGAHVAATVRPHDRTVH